MRFTDQYRLCPASEPLTEECFKNLPLKFAGPPKLRHADGTETEFRPTYVTEGTTPAGSTWAMNPIPVCARAVCARAAQITVCRCTDLSHR